MSDQEIQSSNAEARNGQPGRNMSGGVGGTCAGASTFTSIDLTKRGDLDLVYRAVLNGWDVPDHVRQQLCEQLSAAFEANSDDNRRSKNRLVKLARLATLMDTKNMIDAGHPKSRFPYLRKRYAEKRLPRRG